MNLFDLMEAERLRDEALQRVASNAGGWIEEASGVLHQLAREVAELTADTLRKRIEQLQFPEPHHFNAYGALWRRAKCLGWIEPTGRTVKSCRGSLHATALPVWRSLIYRRKE